jgi:GNAT superfamily N-acetyltransferase
MKLTRWKRFDWKLATLPDFEDNLPEAFNIRSASRDEERAIRNVVFPAFSLDSEWGDSLNRVRHFIEEHLGTAFHNRAVPCLVVTHGQRIIAASALNSTADAVVHLVSGPCVLPEYRNRGIGTALLYESLMYLKTAGLERATGISKEQAPAAKFVYTKFSSESQPFDFDTLLQDS